MKMNIPKNVYEYLANFADDKTIVKMLSVNKIFNDPIFFQRIFQRKYPLLVRFKKDNENWKQFYLRMVKYISKLEEEYDVPYIPSNDFDPYDIYIRGAHKHKSVIFYEVFKFAIKTRNKDIINHFLTKTEPFLEKYGSVLENGLIISGDIGDLEMVKYFIDKGAKDLNNVLNIVGGVEKETPEHLEIVKYLIEKGATSLYDAWENAEEWGNQEIANYLREHGAFPLP